MNRIYQGRVTRVEIPTSKGNPSGETKWRTLDNWPQVLREQHEIFQDSVNYYVLGLAAMAEGLRPSSKEERAKRIEVLEAESLALKEKNGKKGKLSEEQKKRDEEIKDQIEELRKKEAVWQWREQVAKSWEWVERGAEKFEGPKERLSKLLGLPKSADSFEDACKAVLKLSEATAEQRVAALMRLLELAGKTKGDAGAALTPLCTEKVVWFCSRPEDLDATDDVTKSVAERAAWEFAKRLKEAPDSNLEDLVGTLNPADFTTRERGKTLIGKDAIWELLGYFNKLQKDSPGIKDARCALARKIRTLRENKEELENFQFRLPKARVGLDYKAAKVFKILPHPAIAAVFRKKTEPLAKRKDVQVLSSDALADARTGANQPHFDYFSNLAFVPPAKIVNKAAKKSRLAEDDGTQDDENRANWFEFDLAAFVEALKAPHRYYQDTRARDEKCGKLGERVKKMDHQGEDADAEDETSERIPGFRGDHRIDAIKRLIRDKDLMAYLEEEELDENQEYGVNENTLRGWGKLRDAWREAVEKPEFADPAALQAELNRIRIEQQGERPEEAGSGGLFKFLQKPEYQCTWRDKPTGNQSDDPLWEWVRYRELKEKIKSLSEPIRFTPAHPTKSPRFFIFPKTSRASGNSPKNSERPGLKSDHVPKMFAQNDDGQIVEISGKEKWLQDRPRLMAFHAGVLQTINGRPQPTPVRIYYCAPRLRRDAIRGEGKDNLGSAPLIQPMMEALGIAPKVPSVNFANCAVTLLAEPDQEDEDDGKSANDQPWRINLAFPVSLEAKDLSEHSMFQHAKKWSLQSYKNGKFHAQFEFSGGDDRREISLRWPWDRENSGRTNDPKTGWWYERERFTCLSLDLGQRVGGAFAVLDARTGSDFGKNKKGEIVPSRFIGATPGKQWYAAVIDKGLLSLCGEDADVFRPRTRGTPERPSPDDRNDRDKNPGNSFREELWGDRGRPPLRLGDPGFLYDETEEAGQLLKELDQLDIMPANWDQRKSGLSFPEQNDYLLKAILRFRSRIRRLHRWCAFLSAENWAKKKPEIAAQKQQRALEEIREACGLDKDGKRKEPAASEQALAAEAWIGPSIRSFVEDGKCDARLKEGLESLLRPMLDMLPRQVETIANRSVPLRGRQWKWINIGNDQHGKPLHELRKRKPARPNARMKMPDGEEREVTWIRGQRGLSSARIDQIENLRRVLQSLNQIERRKIGELPKRQRSGQDGGVPRLPDCCPALLEKLAELKEQRVNQLAHQVLAQALGVRLRREGSAKTENERAASDVHGEYERIPSRYEADGYRRPVDFIVIEDLKYYETTVMRSRRENTRLMRWCRRHFRNKLKQLCEVFGIPVIETNPADTSKFCSRSGVAGFRAVEVGRGFESGYVWNRALKQLERHEKGETRPLEPDDLKRCLAVRELVKQVEEASHIPTKDGRPRTLLAPEGSGNVFVPAVALDKSYRPAKESDPLFRFLKPSGSSSNGLLRPVLAQVDINAAVDLGLRAIAEPRLWEVHPRLRTARPKPAKPGGDAPLELTTREKRRYTKTGEKLTLLLSPDSAIHKTRQPHYFRDFAELTKWDTATVSIPGDRAQKIELVSGKALWGAVKKLQWDRCLEINERRLRAWRMKDDDVPM